MLLTKILVCVAGVIVAAAEPESLLSVAVPDGGPNAASASECKTVLKGLNLREVVITMAKDEFQISAIGDDSKPKTIKAKCIAIQKSFGSRGLFAQVPKNKDGSESVIL